MSNYIKEMNIEITIQRALEAKRLIREITPGIISVEGSGIQCQAGFFKELSKDKEYVINIVLEKAKTGAKGNYGDGKVFVSPVDEVYTISSGVKEV